MKAWYASKTIWVNAIALIASLLALLGIDLTPEQQGAFVTAILAAVNIILRFFTRDAIERS